MGEALLRENQLGYVFKQLLDVQFKKLGLSVTPLVSTPHFTFRQNRTRLLKQKNFPVLGACGSSPTRHLYC